MLQNKIEVPKYRNIHWTHKTHEYLNKINGSVVKIMQSYSTHTQQTPNYYLNLSLYEYYSI